MKHAMTFGVSAILVALLLSPGSICAADKKPETTWGNVTLTGEGISGERDSAKLEEYRDLPNCTGDFEVNDEPDGKHYFWLKGKEVGAQDQSYKLDVGEFGDWRLKASFDETPHRFAYDAHYLYSGIGTSVLSLPAGLQVTLQPAGGVARAVDLNTIYEPNANIYDLALYRKRTKASLALLSTEPLNVNVTYRQENRTGERPFMAMVGFFGGAVELAEPIDYLTRDWSTSADYVRNNWSVGAKYTWSTFDDNNSGLVFDNPLRATDSAIPTVGARQGEFALYPSNTFDQFTLNGAFGASPWHSRLSWMGSWGRGKQNAPLLPLTTNTAIVYNGQNMSSLSTLPFASVDHTVDTALYDVFWTARPTDKCGLRARYRSYEWQDKTPEVSFPNIVPGDAFLQTNEGQGPGFPTESPKFRDRTLSLDADWDIFHRTVLTIGYSNLFSSKNGREVTTQNENTYKISVDNHTRDWLTLRASYLMATRGGNYDYTVPFGLAYGESTNDAPLFRKVDVARRDRNDLQLQATAVVGDRASVSGMFITGIDHYPDSTYGVQSDHHTVVGLDGDIEANKRCTITGFVSREYLTTFQMGHQWNPAPPVSNGIGDPYSASVGGPGFDPNDWTEADHSVIDTVGAGVKLNLKPKKRDLEVNYTFSRTNGSIDFESPLGTAANDTSLFTPLSFNQVDNADIFTLNVKYKAEVHRNCRLTLGWLWQKLGLDDFNLQGYANVPVNSTGAFNGMILAGTLPQGFDSNVVYANLNYKF